MNIEKMLKLQHDFSDKISTNCNVKVKNLLSKKILALLVHIGKLADATDCYKYWTNTDVSSKKNIIDEYSDCLGFILNLGSEKGYYDTDLEYKRVDISITDQFLNIYVDLNDFIVCSSNDNYKTIFNDFLSLGLTLNVPFEEIEETFEKKIKLHAESYLSACN